MKVWLFETISNFFGPIQGPARLYAHVKKSGFDIAFKNFNQEAYFRLLSRDYIGEALTRLEDSMGSLTRSQYMRKSAGSLLMANSNDALQRLLSWGTVSTHFPTGKKAGRDIDSSNICYELISNKDFVLSEIEKSGRALYKDFLKLSPDLFLHHFMTLLCGKAIIDTAYYPAQIDFSFGFSGSAYSMRASDICRSVMDEQYNFMIPYFRREIMPLVEKEQPEIIGIPITHSSEFVPVFTFASLIRKMYPDIHICLGGATLTEVAFRIRKNPCLHGFFDSMITGPGEHAFCRLIEQVEKGKDLSAVPNLIFKKGGVLHRSKVHHEFDMNDASCPEYVSVRPGSPLPLETSNTCYWGRCVFCYYPRMGLSDITKQHDRRSRNLESVFRDIETLQETYDPLYITFTDSAIPPKRLEQIAGHCFSLKKRARFSAFIRFEKEFTSLPLCRDLAEKGFLGGQVGLESGSQETNDRINKGVKIKTAETILKNFHKAGILVHVYSIVGVLGESEEQAFETYKFFRRLGRFIGLGWQIYNFCLLEKGPLAERAKEFGIAPVPLPDDYLSQIMDYTVDHGLTLSDSTRLSVEYHEKLKHLQHPLTNIFDIESTKTFLLAQHAKGIDISRITI